PGLPSGHCDRPRSGSPLGDHMTRAPVAATRLSHMGSNIGPKRWAGGSSRSSRPTTSAECSSPYTAGRVDPVHAQVERVPHRGQRDGVVVRAPAEPPAATADGPRSESNPGDVEISTPPEETRAAGQKRFAQAAATGASTRGSANRVDVDYRWVAAAAPTVLRLRQLGQPDDRH